MTGSYCLKNRRTCSKLHHFTSYARNVHLQRASAISNVDELERHIMNECADLNHAAIERTVGDIASASIRVCFRYFNSVSAYL